jgi:tellurite resistance-related uncharacterized protein
MFERLRDMVAAQASQPYRTTPVFDENSLPVGLRRDHRTKAGVWGVIRVLEGEVIFTRLFPPDEERLCPGRPGLVLPDQPHFVTPAGPMRMQVEFYDHLPAII